MPDQAVQFDVDTPDLEVRIIRTGSDLVESLGRVLDAVPGSPQGPQALARQINIDKVLASRVLRAVKSSDAMSALHRFPGPDPLRRVLAEASKQGVEPSLISDAARAVDRFAGLIRDELGDRGALDAIVSAWVPEARRDFETRWKQSAFKAMSQLKGVRADTILATALIRPSADGEHLDLVWVSGLFGLQRLRPGASVKLATRRMSPDAAGRRPMSLDGTALDGLHDSVLKEFSSSPVPQIGVHRTDEVVHYTLDSRGFGPGATRDLALAEANFNELPKRYDTGDNRQGFVFAEVPLPSKVLQLDAIIHHDVFPGSDPRLRIYDTAMEGVADVNDRARDLDLLDMIESIESLGHTAERIGSSTVPRYGALLSQVFGKLDWNPREFRVYRARIDYPIYGSQISMCFDLPRAVPGTEAR